MVQKRKVTKKAKKVEFADGKDQSVKDNKENIESLMGFKIKNNYGASTAEEFQEKIDRISISDLQALAVSNGVFPSGTKAMLKNKLKKAFSEYLMFAGRTPTQGHTRPIMDPEGQAAKDFLRIMNGN
jgi:hypothetical protein